MQTNRYQLGKEGSAGHELGPISNLRILIPLVISTAVAVLLLGVLLYSSYVWLTPSVPSQPTVATPTSLAVLAAETATPGPLEEAIAVTPVVTSTSAAPLETSAVTALQTQTATVAAQSAAGTSAAELVDVQIATVTSLYGLNARTAPSPDAEIIRILEQDEIFYVLGRVDVEWLQLFINPVDTELVDGQPISGTVGYASAEFLQLTDQRLSADVVAEILQQAGIPDPNETENQPAVASLTPTTTVVAEIRDGELAATVAAINGLNIRSEPDLSAPIVTLLEDSETRAALQISADNAWVQLRLIDNSLGWAAAEFLVIDGDVSQLSTATSASEEPLSTVATSVTNTYSGSVMVQAAVATIYSLPSTDAPGLVRVAWRKQLQATGRTIAGDWVQIQDQAGAVGWIPTDSLRLDVAIENLPVALTVTPSQP